MGSPEAELRFPRGKRLDPLSVVPGGSNARSARFAHQNRGLRYGTALARSTVVSTKTPELLMTLIERFGVAESFAQGLAPLLDRCDLAELDATARDELLGGLAAVYHGVEDAGRKTADPGEEAVVLVDELRSELRKMDESLKVLGAFVAKLRKQIEPSTQKRLVH